jgi:hypothetical protein
VSDARCIDSWLSSYIAAWRSDSPEQVGALFAVESHYFTAPYVTPLSGRDEIVAWWLEQHESEMEWTFDYEVLASNGNLHVVRGEATYPRSQRRAGGPEVYHDIWLITLDNNGECREFIEYWMVAQ